MAPRTHLTDLGSIANVDLTELGAGKEGWLDNPNLLCALDTNSLAIANRYYILVLEWSNSSGTASFRVKVRPNLSPIEAEYISSLEWLVFDDIRVIAIGTSCGYLLIYSLGGDLIHKQLVYPGRILRLRVRGTKRDLTEDTSSFEEVCAVIPGIIARFDGSDLQKVLQKWYQETQNQFWNPNKDQEEEESENSFSRIPYQLWNVNGYGSCVDAAITGVMPPPLLELQLVLLLSSRVIGIIVLSPLELMLQFQPSALPLTCLKDHPRKGEKLTLSPSGTLAAITDSLGRIMLLDTRALVAVRLWKGYRDASCLFVERLVNKDGVGGGREHVKNDYCLCLAIHAPRKGIVEIWQMRTGPRILTIPCPKGSKILQPTYRFGSTVSESSYKPLEVFFLNGDSGQLSRLN